MMRPLIRNSIGKINSQRLAQKVEFIPLSSTRYSLQIRSFSESGKEPEKNDTSQWLKYMGMLAAGLGLASASVSHMENIIKFCEQYLSLKPSQKPSENSTQPIFGKQLTNLDAFKQKYALLKPAKSEILISLISGAQFMNPSSPDIGQVLPNLLKDNPDLNITIGVLSPDLNEVIETTQGEKKYGLDPQISSKIILTLQNIFQNYYTRDVQGSLKKKYPNLSFKLLNVVPNFTAELVDNSVIYVQQRTNYKDWINGVTTELHDKKNEAATPFQVFRGILRKDLQEAETFESYISRNPWISDPAKKPDFSHIPKLPSLPISSVEPSFDASTIKMPIEFKQQIAEVRSKLNQLPSSQHHFPLGFISYAWSEPYYETWVRETLYPHLKELGLNPALDVDANVSNPILEFVNAIPDKDYVIIIVTPNFCEKLSRWILSENLFKQHFNRHQTKHIMNALLEKKLILQSNRLNPVDFELRLSELSLPPDFTPAQKKKVIGVLRQFHDHCAQIEQESVVYYEMVNTWIADKNRMNSFSIIPVVLDTPVTRMPPNLQNYPMVIANGKELSEKFPEIFWNIIEKVFDDQIQDNPEVRRILSVSELKKACQIDVKKS